MHFSVDELRTAFQQLDAQFFGGTLGSHTVVEVMSRERLAKLGARGTVPDLERCPDGLTNARDGSLILINPLSDHDWECTLVHEMVHAYEAIAEQPLAESAEGEHAAAWCSARAKIHGIHSAGFFTKLFEIMRARGHNPTAGGYDFGRYFG